jgi:hypothetical protein
MSDFEYEYIISKEQMTNKQLESLQKYAGKKLNISLEPHIPVTLSIDKSVVSAKNLGIFYDNGPSDYLIADYDLTIATHNLSRSSIHWKRCLKEITEDFVRFTEKRAFELR